MSELRKQIIEWIREHGGTGWVLGTYCYLIAHGASPDDAINAVSLFVDEIIARKQGQLGERALE